MVELPGMALQGMNQQLLAPHHSQAFCFAGEMASQESCAGNILLAGMP